MTKYEVWRIKKKKLMEVYLIIVQQDATYSVYYISVEATSEEMCHKLESLILADRRMKVSRLAEETGISAGAVWTIIHETWTCPRSVQDGSQEC